MILGKAAMLALILGMLPALPTTADFSAAHSAKVPATILYPAPAQDEGHLPGQPAAQDEAQLQGQAAAQDKAQLQGQAAAQDKAQLQRQAAAQEATAPTVPHPLKLTRRPDGTTDNLEDAIKGWVRTISQEKGFEEWDGAQTEITPLGPGTHSQLVVLRKNGKQVGYLVAASTPDGGWKLAEYGIGENGLFRLNALYLSLIRQGLIQESITYTDFLADQQIHRIRVYFSPLESFWIVEKDDRMMFFDAKTAEPLPDLAQMLHNVTATYEPTGAAASGAKYRISDSLLTASFDPFLRAVWIRGSQLDLGEDAVTVLSEGLAQGRRVTYAARLFNGKVIAPFAVTGFQTWSDGSSYFFVDNEGTRAVPYAELAQKGHFYPAGDE